MEGTFPRLTIAAPQSGEGKTTVFTALAVLFRRRGLAVCAFKVGPDFIDSGRHAALLGFPCRNLDSVLMPEAAVLHSFQRGGAPSGCNLIEGVMGLFDGRGTSAQGSTADIARILTSPVVLCLKAGGFSRSAAALVRGFRDFSPEVTLAGVIVTAASSESHYALLKEVIEGEAGLPCFGYTPKHPDLFLESRHLGLLPAEEDPGLHTRAEAIADLARLDLDGLWNVACSALELGLPPPQTPSGGNENRDAEGGRSSALSRYEEYRLTASPAAPRTPSCVGKLRSAKLADNGGAGDSVPCRGDVGAASAAVGLPLSQRESIAGLRTSAALFEPPATTRPSIRLGVARDRAFAFYYPDNLEMLEELGAELVFFSPLVDEELPKVLHGLYLGGGFPEVFAAGLAANTGMQESVRQALEGGMPCLAECGGMLYLCRGLTDVNGIRHEMAGFFEAEATMTTSLQRPFGYVDVAQSAATPLGPKGTRFLAHEFHYSRLQTEEPSALLVSKPGREPVPAGMLRKNYLGMYPHVHFAGMPEAVRQFIDRCRSGGRV